VHISLTKFFFLIFGIFSTCFEPDGSSSGRRLYVQVWYTAGYLLRRGYVLKYFVVNRIVVKRVLFKWFKLRWVHGPKKLVKQFYNLQYFFTLWHTILI